MPIKRYSVLKITARFFMPFILILGLYVQFHGEYSPGGGFQAGVIVASGLILYSLIFSMEELLEIIPLKTILNLCCFGAFLYIIVGFITLFLGGNFLEYNVLLPQNHKIAQQIGIITIELGVGIAVFSVMLLIYSLFALFVNKYAKR